MYYMYHLYILNKFSQYIIIIYLFIYLSIYFSNPLVLKYVNH